MADWKPVKVSASISNTASRGGGAIVVPNGNYLLEIVRYTPAPLSWIKNDDNADKAPWWAIDCRLIKGAVTGQTLGTICSNSERGLFRLGQILLNVGIPQADIDKMGGVDLPTYEHFVAFAQMLEAATKGRVFGALVAEEQGRQGKPESRIQEVFPADEYESRGGASAFAPPPAAVPNGVPAAAPAAVVMPTITAPPAAAPPPAEAAAPAPAITLPEPGPLPVEQHTAPAEAPAGDANAFAAELQRLMAGQQGPATV